MTIKQGKAHHAWHTIKFFQTCSEAEKYEPEWGENTVNLKWLRTDIDKRIKQVY